MNSPSFRRVVITGVSRGLGAALAEALIEKGHAVAGCSRSAERIGQWSQRAGAKHDFAVVDVADHQQVDAWTQRLLDEWGVPDLLVNNAGVINRNAPLWQLEPGEFSHVVDVNLKGVFHVIRALLPEMLAAGRGVIATISSGWGRVAAAEVAPYCATKFAVEGLTKSLAQELPEGLAAVAVNPGVVHTEMLESCFGADASSYPTAAEWAARAAPFFLQLGPAQNGQSLDV